MQLKVELAAKSEELETIRQVRREGGTDGQALENERACNSNASHPTPSPSLLPSFQEKVRITKSFWEGRARAISLLQALTDQKEEMRGRMVGKSIGTIGGKASAAAVPAVAAFYNKEGVKEEECRNGGAGGERGGGGERQPSLSGASTVSSISSDGAVADSAIIGGTIGGGEGRGGGGGFWGNGSTASACVSSVTSGSSEGGRGQDLEMQALVALQDIVSKMGQVVAGGATSSSSHCEKEEKEEGKERTEEGVKEDALQMEGVNEGLQCTKCLRALVGGEEGGEGEEFIAAVGVTQEDKGTSTATREMQVGKEREEEEEEEEEFNLEVFKMKRQACKLRDELAKKKFAELAMSVKLKETEEEVSCRIAFFLFIPLITLSKHV